MNYKLHKWSFAPSLELSILTNRNGKELKKIADKNTNSFTGNEISSSVEFVIPKITTLESWQLSLSDLKNIVLEVEEDYSTLPVVDKTVYIGTVKYDTGTYSFGDNNIQYNQQQGSEYRYSEYLVINEEEYSIDKEHQVKFEKEEEENDPLKDKDSVIGFLRVKEEVKNSNYTLTKIWDSNTVIICFSRSYKQNSSLI